MIRFAKIQWDTNYARLRAEFMNISLATLRRYDYEDLMAMVVKHILGPEWSADEITVIDNGCRQGTLLFTIPRNTFQPSEYEYLMTFINYGSCSGCDTLMAAQVYLETHEDLVEGLMHICAALVANITKPYNTGWRKDSEFETVEETL